MPKVTVYYFKKYDIISDETKLSKSMTTLEKIAEIHGVPLIDAAKEIDISNLDPDGFYRGKK